MSTEWIIIVLVAGLALALSSLRSLAKMKPQDRAWYGALLFAAGLLGMTVAPPATALLSADGETSWTYWPLGLVAGLAVVELGPTLARGAKFVLWDGAKALAAWVRSKLGGGP